MSDRLNILVSLASEVVFEQILPLVERSNVDVLRVHSGSQALSLTQAAAYDLMVVQYPLPDLDFGEFSRAVRSSASPCQETPMLILTRDDRLDDLIEYLDGELAQACLVDAAPEQIQKAVSELIGVAMRARVRLGVELAARLESESIQLFCQTVNVSESGLLVRNNRRLPLLTKVRVTLSLPEDSEPIRARGEVVRYSDPGVESVDGIAVRFIDFEENDRARLAAYVAGLEQDSLH